MSASRPDSAVIAEAFDTLRIQSERMANVAPLQNEQNIMGAIQTLEQEVAARFDRLESRQTNFEVAAVNARLLSLDTGGALQPLVDIRDGSDIPHFPATLIQLHTLDEAMINAILPALGIRLADNTPISIKRESIARKWILK